MPSPPVHALAVLSPYFKRKKWFDPLALAASATAIDLESLYYLLMGEPLDHRIWHSFAFTLTLYPVLIGLSVYFAERLLENRLRPAYSALRLKPDRVKYPLSSIYLCCLVGGLSHVFFDMFTHESMPYILYPLLYGNPFYLGQARFVVEGAAVVLAVYSVYLWWKTQKTI
jgi:membrane-bound metal-dependent hydrolase YbcI (DUF457 family)